MQSNQEMIKCAILGEFFENGKALWAVTSHPCIFFSTLQNDLRKITHQYHDDMFLWKKFKFFLVFQF